MQWVRRWAYDLVWQDGHPGRRSGRVDTVAQLAAVVRWAQANPRIRRWSIRPVAQLDADIRRRQTHLWQLAHQVRAFVDEQEALARARATIRHAEMRLSGCLGLSDKPLAWSAQGERHGVVRVAR